MQRKKRNILQIVEKNVDDLVPYENNPRNNEAAVPFVVNSIKEFGFKVPVIIDKDNTIVAGHTRVMAAKELGLETVPCIIADDLTPQQVKAFRLADNKVAEASEWDFEKLDQELDELKQEVEGIDMAQFGFADTPKIEWADVPDLTEQSYEEPKKVNLQCPKCGHVAGKEFFKKV